MSFVAEYRIHIFSATWYVSPPHTLHRYLSVTANNNRDKLRRADVVVRLDAFRDAVRQGEAVAECVNLVEGVS